jgi:TonB family protein
MEARNRNRLLIALALLLVALIVVLGKNSDFWFGTDEATDSEPPTATSVQNTVKAAPATTPAPAVATPAAAPAPVASSPSPTVKEAAKKKNDPVAARSSVGRTFVAKAEAASNPASTAPAPAASTPVPTTRKLAPIEVEVVAGDTHRSLRPGSNAVLVEIPTRSDSRATSKSFQWTPVTNAAEVTRMPSDLPERTAQGQDASYPSLAKQMKVQGSVVLQAFVGVDGGIRDLHVVSGNPILVSAAVEAARQWRFAPYLQNGQAVETQAKIQVNFTIKIL